MCFWGPARLPNPQSRGPALQNFWDRNISLYGMTEQPIVQDHSGFPFHYLLTQTVLTVCHPVLRWSHLVIYVWYLSSPGKRYRNYHKQQRNYAQIPDVLHLHIKSLAVHSPSAVLTCTIVLHHDCIRQPFLHTQCPQSPSITAVSTLFDAFKGLQDWRAK